MESSTLVALLSSFSQLLLLLVLSPNPSTSPSSSSTAADNAFLAVHHFLSSQEIAATLSLLSISRKRKRPRLEPDPTRLVLPRSPDSFKASFRMTSSTFEWLCALLEPLLECRDPVGSPINLSAELRLGIGLFRLATGANYSEISRQFRVSETVARFCSQRLCRVLCTNYRFWIEFPNKTGFETVSEGFETHTGLPNCCGVIGCVRFKYVNVRKCVVETVAAQIMVDANSRILSIVAGFRGNKADVMVLKSSKLYADIEEGKLLNEEAEAVSVNGVAVRQYLIGDEGYPLLPWLMVPFGEAMPGTDEEQFNVAHGRMRLSGLRAVDSLKNWGVLSRPICEEMKMAVAYIGACSILHNGLLMREDYSAMSAGLDERSLYDQRCQYYRDDMSLEESSKASVIRNALATKAKEFQESIFSTHSSSMASLQST